MGSAYWNGSGVDQDYAEALRWYRLAAEQGNADGQNSLGNAFWNGSGVDQDYAEGAPLVSAGRRARQCPRAGRLGNCVLERNGVDQDYAEAVRWYRLAAEQGQAAGRTYILGIAYWYGIGVRPGLCGSGPLVSAGRRARHRRRAE